MSLRFCLIFEHLTNDCARGLFPGIALIRTKASFSLSCQTPRRHFEPVTIGIDSLPFLSNLIVNVFHNLRLRLFFWIVNVSSAREVQGPAYCALALGAMKPVIYSAHVAAASREDCANLCPTREMLSGQRRPFGACGAFVWKRAVSGCGSPWMVTCPPKKSEQS